MQWPARRLLICGMHVHVGVRNGQRAIAIINELRRTLPLFLALSSSSPYFEGEDSGLASARSKVFESLPTAGLPPQLEDWVDFEAFMSTLLDAQLITSIREVWWDIRPHPEFGTIELRMCDAPQTLSEVTAIAALAQCMVARCHERLDASGLPDPPREWTVHENRWLAGRYGLDAALIVEDGGVDGRPARRPVRELVSELVAELEPTATRLGCHAELLSVLAILEHGSGAMRQRQLVEQGATLLDVVNHLADELADDRPTTAVSVDSVGRTRDIDTWLGEHGEDLIAVRRRLHAHPELGGEEYATTELIGERLRLAGLEPRVLASGTGLICDISPGHDERPRLALRADIDALPLDDEKDAHYRSQVPGISHACGHDVHTTVMLGAALYLAHHPERLGGPVRFIFQPDEERVPGGALAAIENGALDDVDAIVGLHCDPSLDAGLFGIGPGPVSSAADMLTITLTGPGGHTARPERTVDMITLAARLVQALPGRIAELSGDPAAVRVGFGMLRSGDAANVIPSRCVLRGSVRTPSTETWRRLPQAVGRALAELLVDSGAEYQLDYVQGVPPVINDAVVAADVHAAAIAEFGLAAIRPIIQSWGGDDFAWYLLERPGAYVRVGVHDPSALGKRLDLHSGSFDVDESAIPLAVRLMVATTTEFFG